MKMQLHEYQEKPWDKHITHICSNCGNGFKRNKKAPLFHCETCREEVVKHVHMAMIEEADRIENQMRNGTNNI